MNKEVIEEQLELLKTAVSVLRYNAEVDYTPYSLHNSLLKDADTLERIYNTLKKELTE